MLVRLLGPVEIEGAKDPVDRRKAVEMVVYLATHPDGLDDERLKTALWPDEQAPQSSFNTTVTRARSRLGSDPDGNPHLPHAAGQGLLASPGDEVLYRERMLACDLAGNPAGVEAVMDELVAVAEALEPYDTLHPATIALYERLSHRRRRTG